MSVVLLTLSCNPVKRVLKDQTKFNQVAEEVIRRGYCVNDTIIEIVTDTVYKTDSVVVNTTKFVGKTVDTTFADGSSVYIDASGTVLVKCPIKRQVQTVNRTETIRDKSLENILKADIEHLDSVNTAINITIKERDLSIKELESSLKWQTGKFYLLIAALAAFVGFRIYMKVKSKLPF